MGYFMGKAKQEEYNGNQEESNKHMFLSLLIPIVAHTLYDYFILSGTKFLLVVFFIFTIAMYIVSYLLVRKTANLNVNFDGRGIKDETIKENSEVSSSKSSMYALSRTLIVSLILFILGVLMIYF